MLKTLSQIRAAGEAVRRKCEIMGDAGMSPETVERRQSQGMDQLDLKEVEAEAGTRRNEEPCVNTLT